MAGVGREANSMPTVDGDREPEKAAKADGDREVKNGAADAGDPMVENGGISNDSQGTGSVTAADKEKLLKAKTRLWLTSVAQIHQFVDDFISYVLHVYRGIYWSRKPAYPLTNVRFTREVGEFIMQNTERLRTCSASKLKELYLSQDFNMVDFPSIFSKCLTSSLRIGYDTFYMPVVYNWFGYCAEVALLFHKFPGGQGIQMAADLLSERLICLALPVYASHITTRTLVESMIVEQAMCAESMNDIFDYEMESDTEDTNYKTLTTEDHVRCHLEAEIGEEALEKCKEDMIPDIKEEFKDADREEQEWLRRQFLRSNYNSSEWIMAKKQTWQFVDDFISYAVEKECGMKWQRSKPLKRSELFTPELGEKILYITKEIRGHYKQSIIEIYEAQNVNHYKEAFYVNAYRLMPSEFDRLHSVRVNNIFAYAAAAATELGRLVPENGIELVANSLARFLIGYILPRSLKQGGLAGYAEFVEREYIIQHYSEQNRQKDLSQLDKKAYPLPE